MYYETKQQIDNRKFLHEPTTILLHKLSCKPWKSTQPKENKRSSMKTIIINLKHDYQENNW